MSEEICTAHDEGGRPNDERDIAAAERVMVPLRVQDASVGFVTASNYWQVYDVSVLEVAASSQSSRYARRVRVVRRDGRGGIPWDDLQVIKNAVLGEESIAVEVFPPASQLVNELNMRHLWEFPECPFSLL